MESLIDISGICTTCNHKHQCTIRLTSSESILLCEEFDDRIELEKMFSTLENDDKPSTTYSGLKGLCMNCDLAATCSIRKPETGIWQCNEYR